MNSTRTIRDRLPGLGLALVLFLSASGIPSHPARAGESEDRLLSITKTTIYGALLGGLLGVASALVVEEGKRDSAIRWGIAIGAFGGCIYGIVDTSGRDPEEFDLLPPAVALPNDLDLVQGWRLGGPLSAPGPGPIRMTGRGAPPGQQRYSMADSKKKSSAAKKGGVAPKTGVPRSAAKPKPAASAGTAKRGAAPASAARRSRPAEAPGSPSRISELERELAEARTRIRQLEEEHDALALFEEEPDAQKQLEEARDEIRSLKADLEQSRARVTAKAPGDLAEIDFDEDAEEEEAPAAAEEIDDVEAIYDRLDDPRVRRRELDRERMDRESEAGDEPFWMVCPKCGDAIEEIESEDVKLERCETCGGIYMDRGEVEMLLSLSRGREGLRRIRNVLTL